MSQPQMRTQDDKGTNTPSGGPVTVRADLMARLGVAARVARSIPTAASTTLPTFSGVIRTQRLTMRPLCAADRAEFLRVLRVSRGHLAAFCPLGSDDATTDEQIFARQLALSEGAVRTGRACRLGAFDKDGRLIGGFNVNDICRGLEHSGELVFWVSADSVMRGYAEEGTRALMAHAMADLPAGLGLHRLIALIAPANDGCRKLARKIGLGLCSSAATVELRINGAIVTHDVYEAFAAVGQGTGLETTDATHVVEGKPSIAEELFGRGLLSVLRTEGADAAAGTGPDRRPDTRGGV
jgi:RimJ/RimL family protein N-acetyltransferase